MEHGATLEKRDPRGATPFLIAASASGCSLEIAQELISLGADPNAVDYDEKDMNSEKYRNATSYFIS